MAITANKSLVGYPYIDIFRIISAAMVVAIHTFPLFSISQTANFILVHVICRVAVPFFFITNGFFLIKSNRPNPLAGFVKKMAKYYIVCIILYLPLNIYSGYFSGKTNAKMLLEDIIWNGTFYHLWYFPAAILGTVIAYALYKKSGAKPALILTSALYLLGLGGDSYYGLASSIPYLNNMYRFMFNFFEYTRNGLFFAPLFVLIGFLLSENTAKHNTRFYGCGLFASFTLMLVESLLLFSFGLMRHYSMYISLPFVMFFLFRLISQKKGSSIVILRKTSLYVYILHPWCIVAIRGAAKLFKLEHILIDISPVFFVCVFTLSLGLSLLLACLPPPNFGNRSNQQRAWAILDKNALTHNLNEMRGLLPNNAQIMAVVKANAYGHGDVWTAKALQKQGVTAFAVATMDEGIRLRKHFVRGTILVLGYTPANYASRLNFWRLTQTAVNFAHAQSLAAAGIPLKVHLKVDTGMHRLGIPSQNINEFLAAYSLPNINITGIFTHLARADSEKTEDKAFTKNQIRAFYKLTRKIEQSGISPGKTHLQSSYALMAYPGIPCDYARIGIALYGAHSTSEIKTPAKVSLQPVMSVYARVGAVQTISSGEWVGYGAVHCCKQATRTAVVTFGYADGMPRNVSGGRVLINGYSAPIIGRVCMDAIIVDISGIQNITEGCTATIIGKSNNEYISAEEIAEKSGTITNELFIRTGSRVKKLSHLPANC